MKTPSSPLPGWITGLCLFQVMAGCGCVPVSLSSTSVLPEQSVVPAGWRFAGINGCSAGLKIKPLGRDP